MVAGIEVDNQSGLSNASNGSPELEEAAGSPTRTGSTSPSIDLEGDVDEAVLPSQAQKKKKKKKPKKSAKAKEVVAATKQTKEQEANGGKPSVLCISRNKHWRYISSYHVSSHF
jgi:hypothetical protein